MEVGLVRVDSRLLHGQVVTRWIGQVNAKEVLILDDDLAKDDFMSEIFVMAAPPGVAVKILSIAAGKEYVSQGDLSKTIVLLKGIPSLLMAINEGYPFSEIQIGGIGGAPNRVVVFKNITLTKEEHDQLTDLANNGKNIYLQTVPEDRKVKLNDIISKFK